MVEAAGAVAAGAGGRPASKLPKSMFPRIEAAADTGAALAAVGGAPNLNRTKSITRTR